MSKRLFIAMKINPASEILDFFSEIKELLEDEKINWVKENNFHLTLKFLGETDEETIPEISVALQQICSETEPFEFQLTGSGYFGSHKSPRVVFIKIRNTAKLESLSSEINDRLLNCGFENENRKFKAHLTLGRIKFIKNTQAFYVHLEKHKNTFFQSVKVDEIILYESKLQPEGPVYKAVEKFPFKGL